MSRHDYRIAASPSGVRLLLPRVFVPDRLGYELRETLSVILLDCVQDFLRQSP